MRTDVLENKFSILFNICHTLICRMFFNVFRFASIYISIFISSLFCYSSHLYREFHNLLDVECVIISLMLFPSILLTVLLTMYHIVACMLMLCADPTTAKRREKNNTFFCVHTHIFCATIFIHKNFAIYTYYIVVSFFLNWKKMLNAVDLKCSNINTNFLKRSIKNYHKY